MRRAVFEAVLVLAISACGGTTQSPVEPTSPSTAPASATALATPTTEPPSSASIAPSPVVSEAPVMTAWRKVDPGDGPDAREDHTWTLDPSTRTAYLFGGRDGSTVFDDIWAFDLASDTWRELDPEGSGPDARFGHEAVWVDGVGLVVWAGQAGPTAFFDDLWAYDPAANDWSRLPNDGSKPVARYGSCSAVGTTGACGSATASPRTASGSRTRARTTSKRVVVRRDPGRHPAGGALPARVLADRRWPVRALRRPDDRRPSAGRSLGSRCRAMGDGRQRAPAGAQSPCRDPAWRRHRRVRGLGLDGDYLRDVYRVDGTTLAFEELRPDGARPPARAGASAHRRPGQRSGPAFRRHRQRRRVRRYLAADAGLRPGLSSPCRPVRACGPGHRRGRALPARIAADRASRSGSGTSRSGSG